MTVHPAPSAFQTPSATRKPPEASSWAYSRLEGDLQKPEGYVAHFSLDANAEQGDPFPRAGRPVVLPGARRRPGWPRTGSKRKSRAFGNEAPAPPDAGRPSLPSSTRANQTGLERAANASARPSAMRAQHPLPLFYPLTPCPPLGRAPQGLIPCTLIMVM